MPAGDGTGPEGMGPMTGRGAGYCGSYGMPGYANPAVPRMGLGWRRGRGGSWGRGRRYFGYAPAWGAPPMYGPYAAPPSPAQEVEFLKAQAEGLKEQLEAISQRITELEREE